MFLFFGVCNVIIDNLDFGFGVVNCIFDVIGDVFVIFNDIKDMELCFWVEVYDNDKNWDWKVLVVLLFGVFCVVNIKFILIFGLLVLFFWCIDLLFIFVNLCFGVVLKVEFLFVLFVFFCLKKRIFVIILCIFDLLIWKIIF